MAASSVNVFLTFDPSELICFRSFLVLIFAFQAAVRGSPDSESGFVAGQVVNQIDQPDARAVPHQKIQASEPTGRFSWLAS